MDQEWKCIYKSGNLIEVEILHGMLTENGIAAVVINKKDSSYLFGEAELYVKAEDVIEATRLISETQE